MPGFFRKKEQEPPPPDHRDVPVRMLTRTGWIEGTMRLTGIVRIVDFIANEEFLRLTNVRFEDDENRVEFIAVRCDSILFLIVDSNENLDSVQTVGFQDEHRVTCWIDCGAVQGVMLIRLGARLSDFLARHAGLVVVRECSYRVRNPLTMKTEEGKSWAILMNPRVVVAVTEQPLGVEDSVPG